MAYDYYMVVVLYDWSFWSYTNSFFTVVRSITGFAFRRKVLLQMFVYCNIAACSVCFFKVSGDILFSDGIGSAVKS